MSECIFCNDISEDDVLLKTENFFVVFDIDPIQEGHLLIVSRTHIMNISEMSDELLMELGILERKLINIIERNFDVTGVTLAMNNGLVMDERVHFHVHLIPRYARDDFWSNIQLESRPFSIQKLKRIFELQEKI